MTHCQVDLEGYPLLLVTQFKARQSIRGKKKGGRTCLLYLHSPVVFPDWLVSKVPGMINSQQLVRFEATFKKAHNRPVSFSSSAGPRDGTGRRRRRRRRRRRKRQGKKEKSEMKREREYHPAKHITQPLSHFLSESTVRFIIYISCLRYTT